MSAKNIDLRKAFLGLQEQMCSKLLHGREVLTHPVAKGDSAELEWEEMLATYLPSRYQVRRAFVVDHRGAVSDQIDLVIFDRHYSPFILKNKGAIYIPAESVYAVFEVRPRLTAANLRYAAMKAASVRILKRTSAKIVHAGGTIRQPKKPFPILAGILTTDGRLGTSGRQALSGLSRGERLNLGCSLKIGSFVARFGRRQVRVTESGRQEALVTFFLELVAALQARGTVPAMNLSVYARAVR